MMINFPNHVLYPPKPKRVLPMYKRMLRQRAANAGAKFITEHFGDMDREDLLWLSTWLADGVMRVGQSEVSWESQ